MSNQEKLASLIVTLATCLTTNDSVSLEQTGNLVCVLTRLKTIAAIVILTFTLLMLVKKWLFKPFCTHTF